MWIDVADSMSRVEWPGPLGHYLTIRLLEHVGPDHVLYTALDRGHEGRVDAVRMGCSTCPISPNSVIVRILDPHDVEIEALKRYAPLSEKV